MRFSRDKTGQYGGCNARALLAGALAFCSACAASDWPQLLGPRRDGTSPETNLSLTFPKQGPPVLWRKPIGQGWSSPVIGSDRAYLFERTKDEEVVSSLDANSGRVLWRSAYPSTYRDDFGFDEGPRATPALAHGRLFTFGADGILNGWATAGGSNLWRIDTRKQFGSRKGWFGIACSPLILDNQVILNIGGKNGAGIVAFDGANGKVLWKALEDEASYSSPVVATLGGRSRILSLTRNNLMALEPSGKVLWEFPFRPAIDASVTAALPVIVENTIFISGSYGAGAALLKFSEAKPEQLWSGDDILSSHYATAVHHQGFLYGFDGRQEQRCNLRCVDLETGKVRWSEDQFGAGTVLLVGGKLLILTERGELIVAPASAEKFTPSGRAQILGLDCRAYPALSNGRLFARDKNTLICVQLN